MILTRSEWLPEYQRHQRRVEEQTQAHLERRAAGKRHPVWDFMFTYYPTTPGQLSHWSPGCNTTLLDVRDDELTHLKFFTRTKDAAGDADSAVLSKSATLAFNAAAYNEKRGKSRDFISALLRKTQANPTQFNCFGLHEWAMVYRETPRHPEPLRLGAAGTNQVVEDHSIKCTHYDAYRFFTKAARPLNANTPSRATQPEFEQPGCLHANMDLYKWASKFGEIIPGELWLDCFELACDVRQLDMEASPYDLAEWGFRPVAIETKAGKAEYVARQRALAVRAAELRVRLLEFADSSTAGAPTANPDKSSPTS